MVFVFCCLRYCKSTIFQANHNYYNVLLYLYYVVCDTAKVRFFKQITTIIIFFCIYTMLFAILQKYDFSSKSQLWLYICGCRLCCLRYCKSTIFQANHNRKCAMWCAVRVVCDTAKVRFFKQITTATKAQYMLKCCLRYCKSTIFQANHNTKMESRNFIQVVCDTAKVRFFKQITTCV